jgi:hypothetical protein
MDPLPYMVGRDVVAGTTLIGHAQDISKRYSDKMTPHVHFRLTIKPFAYLVGGAYSTDAIHVDPVLFIDKEMWSWELVE